MTSASARARSPRRGAAPERRRLLPPRVRARGPRGESAWPPPLPRPPSSMSPRRGGGCLGDALSGPPRRPVGRSSSAQPGAPQPRPAAAWGSRAPAAAPGASQPPPPPPGAGGEGGGRPPGKMKAEGGDHSMINLSVQQVLSLWAHGTVLRNLTGKCGSWRGDGDAVPPRIALLPRREAGEAHLAAAAPRPARPLGSSRPQPWRGAVRGIPSAPLPGRRPPPPGPSAQPPEGSPSPPPPAGRRGGSGGPCPL